MHLHDKLAKHGNFCMSAEAKLLFDKTVSQEHDLRRADARLEEHKREIDALHEEIARLKECRYKAQTIAQSAQAIIDTLTA